MINVSIVVPVYNVENYLAECLERLINQSLKDIEIICINDGSTDNSLKILNDYAKKDSRIIVINKENEGQGVARNLGISLAKGEYVGFVDPDDLVHLDMYRAMYMQGKSLNSEIVICDITKYLENDNEFLKTDFWLESNENCKVKSLDVPVGVNIDKELVYKSLLISPCYSCNRIYKTDFLKANNINFGTARCFEDCVFIVDSMYFAKNISYIDSDFYIYRIHQTSTLRNLNSIHFELLNVFEEVENKFKMYNLEGILENNLKFFQVMNSIWTYEKLNKGQQKEFLNLLKNKISSTYFKQVKKIIRVNLANKIFSITNKPRRKVVNIAGFQIKFKHLKGQYKLEQDYINKLKRNQKKYKRDTYLLFDCLQDSSVEAIDAYSLFLYMRQNGKNVYYVLLKDNKLYKQLESENNLDNIIGLDKPSRDYPGSFLESLYDVLLHTKCVITSFAGNSEVVEKFFKRSSVWQYIFIQHGPTFLKESVFASNYLSHKKFDKILVSSEEERNLFKKHEWSDENLIKAGLPRWDLLDNVEKDSQKSILVMLTWRKFNQINFEKSLYKKNLFSLLKNKELNDYLKEKNVKLYFAPHHALVSLNELEFVSDLENVQFIKSNEVSRCIRKCSALITDFSSVAFDFMFQNKPVIYYLLDKEDSRLSDLDRFDLECIANKKNNIPNMLFDEKSVVRKIKYYIDNDFVIESEVKEKYDKFFYTKNYIRAKLVEEIDKSI